MVKGEHFTNGRCYAGGIGLALMLGSLSAQASNWPHYISIGAGYGAGLVLFFLATALIIKSYLRPDVEKCHLGETSKNEMKGVIGERLLQAGSIGTYVEAAQPPSLPLPKPTIYHEFDFEVRCEWIDLVYELNPGAWKRSGRFDYENSPRKSLVIHFSRPVPPKNSPPSKYLSLIAKVKVTNPPLNSEQVPHAYWLEREYNELVFDCGTDHAVIIGSIEGPVFAFYENLYEDSNSSFFSVPIKPLGQRKFLPNIGTLIVEVSLFNSYENKTVEQRKFSVICSPTPTCGEIK